MADDRSYHSKAYKLWKLAVLVRDGYQCAITGAKSPLEVHHIKPWSTNPALRYDVSNGITLERSFHQDVVTGHEAEFEARFRALVKARSKKENEFKVPHRDNSPISAARKKWKRKNPRMRF